MLVIDPKLQFQNEKCSRLKCCDPLYYIAGSEPTLLPGSGPALLAGSQLIPALLPGSGPAVLPITGSNNRVVMVGFLDELIDLI